MLRKGFTCPLKGRRAPELAAGLLHERLDEMASYTSCGLSQVTVGLSATDTALIHDAYDIGVGRLLACVKLKLAVWMQLPWKLCGSLCYSAKAVLPTLLTL